MKIALKVKEKMIMKMTSKRSLKKRKTPSWTNLNSKSKTVIEPTNESDEY